MTLLKKNIKKCLQIKRSTSQEKKKLSKTKLKKEVLQNFLTMFHARLRLFKKKKRLYRES